MLYKNTVKQNETAKNTFKSFFVSLVILTQLTRRHVIVSIA